MKPFVLLQTRPENLAADNEYEAFVKFSGLDPNQLRRYRIHDGMMPELKLEDYSGIFIGGGPYCVTLDQSKKTLSQKRCESGLRNVVKDIIEADFPLLAACYTGVIVEGAGGTMSRRYPEVIGAYDISLTPDGKKDRLLNNLPATFSAFSGHKEACEMAPPGATILATAKTCPVHIFRIKRNIYACQFHPELDNAGLSLRVQIYKNYGYYPPEDAASLIEKATKEDVSQPTKILRNFANLYHQQTFFDAVHA